MSAKHRKSPSEYPMFAFRLSAEQKNELNDALDNLKASLNKTLDPTQKRWMKNDLIYEALKIGLPKLKTVLGKRK